VGDTSETVIDILGEPKGRGKNGNTELFFYDRGTVTIRDGKVVSSRIVSPQEAAERIKTRQEEQAAREEARRVTLARLLKEGTAEKEKTLADAEFKKKAPAEQLAYWSAFQRKYPNVSATNELAAAQSAVDKLDSGAQKKRQLANWETELAQAQMQLVAASNELALVTNQNARRARKLALQQAEQKLLRVKAANPTNAPAGPRQ
jgi:hypothetical protein